jgi:hypothetical protein
VCEGQRVPDGQGVKGLRRIDPSVLLEREQGFALLASIAPGAEIRAVREVGEALRELEVSDRPPALRVAGYLDAVAGGKSASEALPLLGAFADPQGSLSKARLMDNIRLAAQLGDPDTTKSGTLQDIRGRAERVLGGPQEAEAVVRLLHSDPDQLLEELSFQQAWEILRDPPAQELPDAVKAELKEFQNRLGEDPDALYGVIEGLLDVAEELRSRERRQEAATQLLAFHTDRGEQQEKVFLDQTHKKLLAMRRNRRVSSPSIERSLVQAIEGLVGKPITIEIREPALPQIIERETHARAVLALMALRMRAEPLFAVLREHGVEVAGAAEADLDDRVDEAAPMLGTPKTGLFGHVSLAVRGADRGDVVEVDWSPSPEDQALVLLNARFLSGAGPRLVARGPADNEQLAWSNLDADLPDDPAADEVGAAAGGVADKGFDPEPLERWCSEWRAAVAACEASDEDAADEIDRLSSFGCVHFPDADALLLSHLHPLKAEWLANRTRAWVELLKLALGDEPHRLLLPAATELASSSSSQYPAFVRYGPSSDPLLPVADGTVISVYGSGGAPSNIAPAPISAVEQVLDKLVGLHPESRSQVRVAALGDHACDLLLRALVGRLEVVRRPFERAELTCIGGRPSLDALRGAEALERAAAAKTIELRYVDDVSDLPTQHGAPGVHLGVVSGLATRSGRTVNIGDADVDLPDGEPDPVFAPKTWLRAGRRREILLCPPGVSENLRAYQRLQAVHRAGWRAGSAAVPVPTLSVDVGGLKKKLVAMHDFAQWVLTIDRYAARDTLQQLLGDTVAILHQERRTSGAVSEGLVISQKSGGAADRAIARALVATGIEPDEESAHDLAWRLRASASRGHGVLALRAATTGSGINELIGHVGGFIELTRRASPLPFPVASRLVLISLDEYQHWFGRGRRADLLVLALPSDGHGEVWAANVEVKTVGPGGNQRQARSEARSQLQETLKDSRHAVSPDGSLFSRMWLNRIVEAAVGVVRENGVMLTDDEMAALNRFRGSGTPSSDWGGIGLVFGDEDLPLETPQVVVGSDRYPLFLHGIKLDRDLLRDACGVDPGDLKTAAGANAAPASSSKDRLRGVGAKTAPAAPDPAPAPLPTEDDPADAQAVAGSETRVTSEPDPAAEAERADAPRRLGVPLLGVNASTGEPVQWRVTGAGALDNGHVEVYGSSGSGKTQFVKSLLAQLRAMGSSFTVCDFKDDYGIDSHGTDFPAAIGAELFKVAETSLPYNPMAGHNSTQREMQSYCIELRDMIDIAAKQYMRMGPRQLGKLLHALEESFEYARANNKSEPTLADVGALLDDDLRGVIGDLFRFEFFGAGPPLGDIVDRESILSFKDVPGRGLTEDLLVGFVLSAIYLKMNRAPAVHQEVRFTLVVDEAHRVGGYKAIKSIVREQRSKGVAAILATQAPGDLPPEVETNAQTKVFLKLPPEDAKAAGRRLDPDDRDLPGQIRTLKTGEGFVSLGGGAPMLVNLRQFWRDDLKADG